MTTHSKRLALLLGEAAAVVTIDYLLSARRESEGAQTVLRRTRFVWVHAVASETISFVIDEMIRQRRRVEVALGAGGGGRDAAVDAFRLETATVRAQLAGIAGVK